MLTGFIKTQEIRDEMRKSLRFKQFKIKGEIQAPLQTKNSSLVGTAFDYLLRFFIEQNSRKNTNRITKREWVAQNALDRMLKQDKKGFGMYRGSMDIPFPKMVQRVRRLVDRAEKNHRAYIEDGKITDSLLKTCIHLAQIDPYVRALAITKNMGTVDKMDVADLRSLISLPLPKRLVAKRYACLNPTFGYGSSLVGGADADLIIDGILIDIKTVTDPIFKRDHYHQLVGYYILSLLGIVRNSTFGNQTGARVSHIGIYFARHGVLRTFPTKSIVEDPGFPKLVEVFERKATEQYLRSGRTSLPWEEAGDSD